MTVMETGIPSLQEQENKLLQALGQHLQQLRPAKVTEVKPGTPLYYPLGDSYGVHIVRGAKEVAAGYVYKDPAGLRAGVEAGTFLVLDHDDSNGSPGQEPGICDSKQL